VAGLDAIGPAIWSSMFQALADEGGGDGRCGRSVAAAGDKSASDASDDRGRRQECDGHELSSPTDGTGQSRGWQPGAKVSMMVMRRPQQGQAFLSLSSGGFGAPLPLPSPPDGSEAGTPSRRRAKAILPVRLPLAKRP
jgi:hypothetical protein